MPVITFNQTHTFSSSIFILIAIGIQYKLIDMIMITGPPLNYWSLVALFFMPVASLLLCGGILSTTGDFTHNIKGKSSMLSFSTFSLFISLLILSCAFEHFMEFAHYKCYYYLLLFSFTITMKVNGHH